ncbi:MAG: glycogen synthase GlgA [Bryobacteraceae bacterium]
MSKILMVASEATPFAKTGGLADVIGALPRALNSLGDEAAVVLPLYPSAQQFLGNASRVYDGLQLWLGSRRISVDIRLLVQDGVPFYFVDCPPLYARDGIYGTQAGDYPDNHIRFAALCYAALGIVRYLFRPDIIHCHDWQTAVLAPLVKFRFAGDPTFLGPKTLLTIHNLGYQGLFPRSALSDIGLDPGLFHMRALEFYGQVNFLKGGILFSDALSTVSKGYAKEIQTPEHGFGLDDLLRERSASLTGIVNGVDYGEWSPEQDTYIAVNYSRADLSGKKTCKRDLLATFGLPAGEAEMHRPLLGIVSRFAGQKGFDLIEAIAEDLAAEDVSLVVIGSGEARYENVFRSLAVTHPDRFAVKVGYSEEIAHKVEAGADMFLMPSRYEPCGLNQIYSLRYGTVPIVRATGGLDDTIDKETGFKFREYSGLALLEAIRAALALYRDKKSWREMMANGMKKNFSWDASAAEYSALYRRLIG